MILKTSKTRTPFVLAILDGWGRRTSKVAAPDDPTRRARTPFMRELEVRYPFAMLGASGLDVGLPAGQDGNSEAGHLNLGAGRIVEQDAVYISQSIKDGSFFKNHALLAALAHVKKRRSTLHLMGLLSNYNSGHASPDHFFALLKLAAQHKISQIRIHFFTDGRDSPKYDAVKFLGEVQRRLRHNEKVASLTGRFYGMDRKKTWLRTEQTYNLLTRGQGIAQESGETALRHAYNRGESDEYLSPTVITDAKHHPLGTICNNDAVIFFNLRSDRARQLAKPFVQTAFERENPGSFRRWKVLKNLCFVALTDFGPDLGNILTAFPSRDVQHSLPMALAGLKQLYLAESEKFAHMTYFFNGGYDHSVAGEQRQMVPSPNVTSYDRAPAMAAAKLTRAAEVGIRGNHVEFVGMNFANLDMVGHTGNYVACIKALEVVDACLARLGRLTTARGGTLLITADHGNIEETVNQKTGEIDTEHSTNLVPCLLYRSEFKKQQFVRRRGILADVAPTILDLLGLPKPEEMNRQSLFRKV